MRDKYGRSLHYVGGIDWMYWPNISDIYRATLWMRETATYLPSAVKAAALEKMDRLAYNSDADIRTYDKSHGAEEKMEVFWHPLKFITDYAVCGIYLARSRQRSLLPGFPFCRYFFLTSPLADPLSFSPLLPSTSRLFSREFHFLANSANLCITASPAICRANKSGRDNVLIDL